LLPDAGRRQRLLDCNLDITYCDGALTTRIDAVAFDLPV
jgi:hypothetical protein